MEKKTAGRPIMAGSVTDRILKHLQQVGKQSGSQLRQWAREEGIGIDSLNQNRHRMTGRQLVKTVVDGVYFWEVCE